MPTPLSEHFRTLFGERGETGGDSRVARSALALGAGALTALSLPPWGFWPLAIVGVMLFEVTLGEFPTRRERLRLGALFGAGWMYLGMGWMVQLTVPGYIAAGLIFTTFHALAALVAPTGRWRVIGRPAAHTLVEALRLSFPFGGVPLATLGVSQVAGPLGGVARVGGVILLTWVVFQLGFALAGPAPGVPAFARKLRPGAGRGQPHGTVGFLAVVVVIVLSVVAPSGSSTGRTLDVAAVQGGGEQGTTALEVPSELVTERHIEATRTIDVDPELDVVIWPENTIDVNDDRRTPEFEGFDGSDQYRAVAAEAARLGVPILVGITEDAITDDPTERRFVNSQIVVLPDGSIGDRYDKVRRVPFGEYVPLRGLIERVSSAVDRVGEAVAGEGRGRLDIPLRDGSQVRAATVISWEVFFGGRAREGVVDGAEFIINPTNGSSYTGTIVQTQQVASSRLRAIETGRYVVQAAPTGFTAIVDADGNVLQRTSVSEQRVLYAEIELRDGDTWYVSIGDGPFIWLVVIVLLGSIALADDVRLLRRRTADTPVETRAETPVESP